MNLLRVAPLALLLAAGCKTAEPAPDYWQPLHDFLCRRMVEEKTILPADCERILFTDSVDVAMERILSAATGQFGLVWQAAPPRHWYLGEPKMQKPDLGPSPRAQG